MEKKSQFSVLENRLTESAEASTNAKDERKEQLRLLTGRKKKGIRRVSEKKRERIH